MVFPLVMGAFTYLLAVIWGAPLIEVLRRLRAGKREKHVGHQAVIESHAAKEGTPTFGGVLMIVPAVAVTLLVSVANVVTGTSEGRSILIPLAGLLLFGGLGSYDDWEGLQPRGERGKGISAAAKFGVQILFAVGVAAAITFLLDIHTVAIPGVPFFIDLGFWSFPIAIFIILATSNAVNLTDGLDGLAGNLATIAFAAYGIIAFLQGQTWLSIFSFIIVGCTFGFLWYNAHPAKVFMGDTGSQALGAGLGIVALMSSQWLLLPVIGSMFTLVTLSVILQKMAHKYGEIFYGERKRIFKMAPIHHHFTAIGWGEVQIVFRAYFVNLITAILGIALALI